MQTRRPQTILPRRPKPPTHMLDEVAATLSNQTETNQRHQTLKIRWVDFSREGVLGTRVREVYHLST